MPAHYGEAFGLYLIEAMAAGVPVVQPRTGAFPELVAASGAGVICEPEDPKALGEAIEAVLLNPDQARAFSAAGRLAVATKFNAGTMAVETLTVFDKLTRRSFPS